MNFRTLYRFTVSMLVATCASAQETALSGTVSAVTGTEVQITLAGGRLPNAGDKVDFYFKIPGLDDEVSVGSGTVKSTAGNTAAVKFEQGSGKPQAGQLARIHSAAPREAGTMPARSSTAATSFASPPTTSDAPVIADLKVMPLAITRDGNFGIRVTATAPDFPAGATEFAGWVKELSGVGVATLDRTQRSPGGGLGFQSVATDRALSGFITSRSIGLPAGDYDLKMEVLAASGGTQAAIPYSDKNFEYNGQLAVAVQFRINPGQFIDGLRMTVPFDLFPDADRFQDITFYDEENQPENRITGVPFHPRG